ncbi:hypothetical protein MKW98_030822 [Papaver atlanticum]|uniref:Uncharacterized protein n=1 Tax=Papaver atlanticum TaxID=357466 RepID=A0AAD4X721_9MAGN|nr:hypothetical protein MKW98_030822 [Papaver atlanticum]
MDISARLKKLADTNEKKLQPLKLKIKRAIEKKDKEEILIQARNMVRRNKEEVTNYRQVSDRLDSLYGFLDEKPWLENIYHSIPTLHESVDSFITTRNLQKMMETIDQVEEKYFNEKILAEFRIWAASKGTPILVSEDEEINTLIQQVTDECELDAGSRPSESSRDLSPEVTREKKWCVIL